MNARPWRRFLLCCLAGTIVYGCAPRHPVHWIEKGGPPKKNGVYYALPRTVVTVEIPVTKTTLKQGPYYIRAAENGIQVPKSLEKKETSISYRLGVPKITTDAEPDPDNVYLVEIKGGWLKNRDLKVATTEQGLITSAHSKAEDKTVDFVVKAIGAAAKIYAASFSAPVTDALGSKKKIMSKGTDKEKFEGWAKLIADRIHEIRAARLRLLGGGMGSGPSSLTNEALDRALTELAVIEEELMSNFRTRSVASWTAVYTCAPEGIETNGPTNGSTYGATNWPTNCTQTLFSFGAKSGLAPGKGVPDIPEAFTKGDGSSRVAVRCSITRPHDQFADRVRKPDKGWRRGSGHGFFYRIPGIGNVAVTKGSHMLATNEISVAQYGAVASLPPGVRSTSSNFVVEFHESTGSLKTVQVTSQSLDPALVTELGDAAATIAQVEASKRAAAKEKLGPIELARAKLEACAKALLIARATGQTAEGLADCMAADEGDDGLAGQ